LCFSKCFVVNVNGIGVNLIILVGDLNSTIQIVPTEAILWTGSPKRGLSVNFKAVLFGCFRSHGQLFYTVLIRRARGIQRAQNHFCRSKNKRNRVQIKTDLDKFKNF
jgi:hypothetical protein